MLDILVGGLDRSVGLWPVCRWLMESHVVFLQQVNHFLLEVGTIIWNDLVWDPISTDDVVPDKLCNVRCFQHSIWLGLDPLCKVIYRDQYELMTIWSLWSNSPDHINSPNRKWPWRSHVIQLWRRDVHAVCMDLAFVASPNKTNTILLHGGLVITLSENLPS